jgi:glycosyltransferase involved in cell wall biosynthesis
MNPAMDRNMDNMKKTIWYISKYSSPLKYGLGSRHFYLAREFNELKKRTIIFSSDSNHLTKFPEFPTTYFRESIDGVETWWIKTLKYKGSASIRRILSWIDFEIKLWAMPKKNIARPDVVIVSSLSLLTILNGFWLKKRYRCRLFFEIRDIWPLTLVEEGGFCRWNPFIMILAWIEKFGYLKSDVIIGTMPNLSEHVRAVTGKNLPCYCFPLGFDLALYEQSEPLPEGFEERYIPRHKFIVGYAGSIGRTNALETVIRCAEQMQENSYIHFLLIGEGAMLSGYQKRVAGHPNISFAPKVKKLQVQSFLRQCHVLYFSAMNSKVWQYGQSLNKMIDYMYAAKPVIASYSGYPSMLNEAQSGVFVLAEDVQALKNAVLAYEKMPRERLEQIGKKGKAWLLENRRYSKIARDYSRLF